MIDGSEKRKRQLVFELQSSRVYEKRSKVPIALGWGIWSAGWDGEGEGEGLGGTC